MSSNRSNDEVRIVRIFRLIKMLREYSMTTKQLISTLEVGKDAVYKDLDLLRELGYLPYESKKGGAHTLKTMERKLQFDNNEKQLISKLLSSEKKNPVSISIKAKLNFHSSEMPSPEEVAERLNARNIERLQWAIDEKLPVTLIKYLSSTPGKAATNREVWPIEIVEDSSQLVAFEVKSNEQKNFKLQRITDVEVLPSDRKRPDKIMLKTDLFGLSGKEGHEVKLNLSKRAWQLMKEEYPRTVAYLKTREHEKFPYRFVGEVRDFKGIRRFIMGLPGEVEVESPELLIEYLKKCMKEYSFFV